MKVIFLKDVPRVAQRDTIKEVNDGYAINYLFPNKLAIRADEKSIKEFEINKNKIKIEKEIEENLLLKNLKEIGDKKVILKLKTDKKGSLFSSVHKKDIEEGMLKQNNIVIKEEFIVLEKPIKQIGEYDIEISIKGKKGNFKLIIESL